MTSPRPKLTKGQTGERDRALWRDKVAGWSIPDLAAKYGISDTRVTQICAKIRGDIPRATADDYRRDFADQLDGLRKEMQAIVDAGPAPAFSSKGDQLWARANPDDYENLTPVMDHAARLAATAQIVSVQARASKLLGLDAAEKAEVDTTVRYVIDGTEDV
jgi:hypothetical protein